MDGIGETIVGKCVSSTLKLEKKTPETCPGDKCEVVIIHFFFYFSFMFLFSGIQLDHFIPTCQDNNEEQL